MGTLDGCCGLFGVSLLGLVVYIVTEAYYYQGQIAAGLRRDLGFRHGTTYLRCGRWLCDVLLIESLTPGGAFAEAGFREGDILVGPSITGLYKQLHRGRGAEVYLRVVDGGEGPPLSERTQRRIIVRVPVAKPG